MDDWRLEKARNVITQLCFMVKHIKSIETDGVVESADMRNYFLGVLHDATKLYCDAVDSLALSDGTESNENRWSPDLPKYLFDHPEKCESALDIVASIDYRDNFYDKER
jgi:hypothetical protein